MAQLDLADLESLDDIELAVAERLTAEPGYARDLTEGDLALLSQPLPPEATGQRLSRLRHGHHALARLLAEGRKAVEISTITGYSQSRISILQTDPAFQELVEYYRSQVQEVFMEVQDVLKDLAMSAAVELRERLEERPESLSTKEVREIMDTAMERGIAPTKGPKGQGLAPQSAPAHIQVTFVSTGASPQPMIDITPGDNGEG